MTTPGIAVQLYSLREASQADFDDVLAQVARIGYQGVEPFNLFGKTPAAFRRQVEDLGMRIAASHFPWANRTPANETIEVLGELGLDRAIGGYSADDFADADALARTAEATNTLVDALAAAGIELCLHNHWWEFANIDGELAYHRFQSLCPRVAFELDTYWAANFGACDPAAELARIAARTPLLHIKDGPLTRGEPMVAVGDGRMDIPPILRAADPDCLRWLIVELDACATDMLQAVATSYRNLRALAAQAFEVDTP